MKRIKQGKLETVEIEIKRLEEIAKYYKFPLVVFFAPTGFLKGTRCKYLEKRFKRKLLKIKEIIEDLT